MIKGMSYASPGGDRVTGIVVVPRSGGSKVAPASSSCTEPAALGSTSSTRRRRSPRAVSSRWRSTRRSAARRSPEVRAGRAAPPVTRELMIRNVKDLVRGFDLLVQRYGVSPERLGIVGYSMGVQPAALAASLDARVRGGRSDGRAAPIRPEPPATRNGRCSSGRSTPSTSSRTSRRRRCSSRAASGDEVIPREEMEQLYAATSEPKEIRWYDAGHELGERSKDERLAWLGQRARR